MIDFPYKLKPYKKFEHHNSYFIADINAQCVFEANPIILDIIDLCEKNSATQIKNSLRLRYQQSEIDEAFRYLLQLRMAGILFDKKIEPKPDDKNFSGQIVLTPGFLPYLYQKPFIVRLVYHRLIKALCGELEVSLPVVKSKEALESNVEFDWEGVKIFEVPDSTKTNIVKYYPSGCHGLFSMPGSSFHDIPLIYSSNIPAIYYVSSDEPDRQSIIDKCFLLREFDILCVDSWWVKDWLSRFVPSVENVIVLPVGIEDELYDRKDKESAKATIASAFQNDRMKSDPVILLFLPDTSYENRRLVCALAKKYPHVIFIVVDGINNTQFGIELENVEFFKVEYMDDYQALPEILSAADIGYYSAVTGAHEFYLSCALHCGVPMVISGNMSPDIMNEYGIYTQINPDDTPNKIVEMVSKNMDLLLENETMRDQYRDNSLRLGKELTWDSAAKSIKNLYISLRGKLNSGHKELAFFPAFFQYYYDIVTGKTTPIAYERLSFTKGDFNKLIAQELLMDHNENQVRIVLEYICGNKEIADKILKQLKG